MADEKSTGLGPQVIQYLENLLATFLADTDARSVAQTGSILPSNIRADLAAILNYRKAKSYRDVTIIQLAYGLVSTDLDHTKRPVGARTVAQALGVWLKSHHIDANNDAYENVGKNSEELCRGNLDVFDNTLRWANTASTEQRKTALNFMLAFRAASSRPVLPMPILDRGALTFVRVASLFDELLNTPSGGAHQQFAIAACLDSIIDEFGEGGPHGLRVTTKNINASDASSGTAADVQVVRGNRVEEAFEITANDWKQKLRTTQQIVRSADLQRMHIVASVPPGFLKAARAALPPEIDISIIDVQALVATLVALMRKPARELALRRFYEFLDRHGSDVERVNSFVKMLERDGFLPVRSS